MLAPVLRTMPDAENLNGFGRQRPINHKVRRFGNGQLACSFLNAEFADMRMGSQSLDGVVNLAAHAVGRGKIALLLDAVGKLP